MSKENLLETTAKRSDQSETCSSDDISSKKNIKDSLVLLCCKDTLRIYAMKSVVQVSLLFLFYLASNIFISFTSEFYLSY